MKNHIFKDLKFSFGVVFMCSFLLSAQEEKVLGTKNGIKVSVQLVLKSQSKKRDKYLLIANGVNNSGKDLYYPAEELFNSFATLTVQNSTQWVGKPKLYLKGELTNQSTTNGKFIYVIKNEEEYTAEYNFDVKKGVKPVITNRFNQKFRKSLKFFNLRIGADLLDGNYRSSCGGGSIAISLKKAKVEEKYVEYLLVTMNGKNTKWKRISDKSFNRLDKSGYTLVFDKVKRSFNYTNSDDGMTSIFKKIQ